MGLLEAGFAIWTVDDFISRYSGSDESHGALQLYLGHIWPLQQRERSREIEKKRERTSLSLWFSLASYGGKNKVCTAQRSQRERICSLRLFKGIFFLPKYIFLEASLLFAKKTSKTKTTLLCWWHFSKSVFTSHKHWARTYFLHSPGCCPLGGQEGDTQPWHGVSVYATVSHKLFLLHFPELTTQAWDSDPELTGWTQD